MENKIKKEVRKVGKEIKKVKNSVFHAPYSQKLTRGQRAADSLAKLAGSWAFIISFFILLGIWMSTNIYAWVNTWDPYPFILLNLVLSCLAAIQAPVILMSQNRAAQKDRIRSEYDYQINRRAERRIEVIQKQLNRIERRLIEK